MTLALMAMRFACLAHADQRRKYCNSAYVVHLAEVAGVVATLPRNFYAPLALLDEMVAVAWLHDCIEDQGVTREELSTQFGPIVAGGVQLLSDTETGNRATRKALACERLAAAPAWVQTIKAADLISNSRSIMDRGVDFAAVYQREARTLLDAMTEAYAPFVQIARELLK